MVIKGRPAVPEGVNPVTVPELATPVHATVVPATDVANPTAAVATPEQRVCAVGVFTIDGVGLMLMTKLAVVPGQLLKVGVTAIFAAIAALVLFVGAVHGLI